MTEEEIKTKVLRILGEIAPEAELANIKPDVEFRDQIDLDSMDYLNFVIALDEEFQAAIPETEYTKFISLNACVEELRNLQNKKDFNRRSIMFFSMPRRFRQQPRAGLRKVDFYRDFSLFGA
jgi:acyl carrier protein